jgi:hypothetical protein
MTDEERKDWERKISTAGDVFRAVLDGELPLEALPKDLQDRLVAVTKKRGVAAK